MEKTITPEERIRRAEEIYARRKNENMDFKGSPYARVNVGEKRKASPIKKMLIQICICIVIYAVFFTLKNGDYISSGQFTNKIKSILEYDISFESLSTDIINYINQINNANATIPEENKMPENTIDKQQEEQNTNELQEGLTEGVSTNEMPTGTLGVTDAPLYTEEISSISQEEIDANYINANYSFIKPLVGTITSRFGTRNPSTPTVPKYHTGIDIAANVGTKIIAAMDGEVTLVSSSGDYRKSC